MEKVHLRNILVPVDFSETADKALEHAGFLAKIAKAELYLMHVVPSTEMHYEIIGVAPDMHYQEKINTVVDERLNAMAENLRREAGIVVHVSRGNGNVAREISTAVKSNKIDLIVMGTHGSKGFEELLIGSNAHKVVTRVNCPVITVQEYATKLGFTSIVLPIDRSRHSREKVGLTLTLADFYAAHIHVLGVLEGIETNEREKLQITLDQVLGAIQKHNLVHDCKIVEGKNVAQETLRYAKEINADMIAIMTDHESEVTGGFMGTFSKQIVNHSRIPVLSVKPREGEFANLDMGGGSSF